MHINYTTYNVWWSQDVIHTSTSHCNIMVLADSSNTGFASNHPFRYARVLSIYHANVVYVGPRMTDYQPHRMEFLWVQWYQSMATFHSEWSTQKHDHVWFASMTDKDAFGFVDPADVLRGCHIVPAFMSSRLHADGKGLSHCAWDSADWIAY